MVSTLAFTFLTMAVATAHKPTFGGDYSSADDAYTVVDPDVSIVVYQDIQCDQDQLWFEMQGEQDFSLYIQLGVPVVERLEGYRPSVALLAPGLPAADEALPFDIPEGVGVQVFHSEEVDVPGDFYEPFTQTSSWVVVEERVTLPESGTAWLVAWDPAGWSGKLWLATGEVEDFSDVDSTEFLYWGEAVNDFHETGRFSRVEPREEEYCGDAGDGSAPSDAGEGDLAPAGCSTAPALGGLAFASAAALARRRRR
jgi:hypothetical protein